MYNKDFAEVEGMIGYRFRNPDLLQQAFIRRSYAEENGGEDNEVLEFIGDKALDFIVVKRLTEKYGSYTSEKTYREFHCRYREGKLTNLKKQLVEQRTLAERIDETGLADYLIMGKGDISNHAGEQKSVKEDLFEAILGAVALDCGWNPEVLEEVVDALLDPEKYLEGESDDEDVQVIQEWVAKKYHELPLYAFGRMHYYDLFHGMHTSKEHYEVPNFPEVRDKWDSKFMIHYCKLVLGSMPEMFFGFGLSKKEARKDACRIACKYLEQEDLLCSIRDEIVNPNMRDAINQLETLARRGYFSLPVYEYEMFYDTDGNPVWRAKCMIPEYENAYWAENSSKKEAKKGAAYRMLTNLLED